MMASAQKGDRKLQVARESLAAVVLVTLAVVACSILQPALAPVAPAVIGAAVAGIGLNSGTHAWGNAKEHEADAKAGAAS